MNSQVNLIILFIIKFLLNRLLVIFRAKFIKFNCWRSCSDMIFFWVNLWFRFLICCSYLLKGIWRFSFWKNILFCWRLLFSFFFVYLRKIKTIYKILFWIFFFNLTIIFLQFLSRFLRYFCYIIWLLFLKSKICFYNSLNCTHIR